MSTNIQESPPVILQGLLKSCALQRAPPARVLQTSLDHLGPAVGRWLLRSLCHNVSTVCVFVR